MYERDTIAAIATAPGVGAVAIIRVSGDSAPAVGRRVFRGFPPSPESHRLYFGDVVDSRGAVLDRALAVWMRTPRSFTGEHVVEVHCHGGPLLARRVLEAALDAGARGAEPGEFSRRAFLNGRLDLAQAESVADLIAARSPAALEAASAQLRGELSSRVEALRQSLIGLGARLEVTIDFSEEDVGELDREGIGREAEGVRRDVERLLDSFDTGRLLREGARVAIAGKPNVGKSSLLNRLLRMDRAIVTELPGTTRDVIEEAMAVEGIPIVLIDTAGIREADDLIEREGIDRTRAAVERADLVLAVFDAAAPLEGEDHGVIAALRHHPAVIPVVNKTDLPRRLTTEPLPRAMDAVHVVEISAKTGDGIPDLLRELHRRLELQPAEGGVVVVRERHAAALRRARDRLTGFLAALESGLPADVLAVEVMSALDALGEIIGVTTPEDVLDRVFREFCIGK